MTRLPPPAPPHSLRLHLALGVAGIPGHSSCLHPLLSRGPALTCLANSPSGFKTQARCHLFPGTVPECPSPCGVRHLAWELQTSTATLILLFQPHFFTLSPPPPGPWAPRGQRPTPSSDSHKTCTWEGLQVRASTLGLGLGLGQGPQWGQSGECITRPRLEVGGSPVRASRPGGSRTAEVGPPHL